MTLPYAVIIAGGEGRRLGGVSKADLRIGGVRLLDRVIAAIGPVARPMLVSTGPAGRVIALEEGCIAVADLDAPCSGPLAGLVAAVDWLGRHGVDDGLLVSAAVDTPFLPPDFVARMCDAIGSSPAAFAAWGDDFYPPNAVWLIETLRALPPRIIEGTGPVSLKALQLELGARRVDWRDSGDNPFANINTPADLLALQQKAGDGGGP